MCVCIYRYIHTVLGHSPASAGTWSWGGPRLANGAAHPPGIPWDTQARGCPGSGWMTGDPVLRAILPPLPPTLLIHSCVSVEISLYPGSLTKGTLALLRTVVLLKTNKTPKKVNKKVQKDNLFVADVLFVL